jgi:hypothetical protein
VNISPDECALQLNISIGDECNIRHANVDRRVEKKTKNIEMNCIIKTEY